MSRYFWIGNSSTNVLTASNWSLYPLTGATLPPAASSTPTGGDELVFGWSGISGSRPLYVPQGSMVGSFISVIVEPNFELDIGSAATPFGISAGVLLVSKKYQSSPAKGNDIPSVYVTTNTAVNTLKTDLYGDAPLPEAFPAGQLAPQCVMQFDGVFGSIECGGVLYDDPSEFRSETLILGSVFTTEIGSVNRFDALNISHLTAKTTLIFGDDATIYTPDINPLTYEKQRIAFRGKGILVKIYRGADFASNSGGIEIYPSGGSTPNLLSFEREAYAGSTGFNAGTRTSVYDLLMLTNGTSIKSDPKVIVSHGVDISGKLYMSSGTFIVEPCQEESRTVGAVSGAVYIGSNTFANSPRMELAVNSSIRNISVTTAYGVPSDITYDSAPMKTFFINQPIIEGYTGA